MKVTWAIHRPNTKSTLNSRFISWAPLLVVVRYGNRAASPRTQIHFMSARILAKRANPDASRWFRASGQRQFESAAWLFCQRTCCNRNLSIDDVTNAHSFLSLSYKLFTIDDTRTIEHFIASHTQRSTATARHQFTFSKINCFHCAVCGSFGTYTNWCAHELTHTRVPYMWPDPKW